MGFTKAETEYLTRLGRNIVAKRKAVGLSQVTLGSLINMEKSNLSAIENGRQNVSSLTLKKIADALKCEVADFFSGI